MFSVALLAVSMVLAQPAEIQAMSIEQVLAKYEKACARMEIRQETSRTVTHGVALPSQKSEWQAEEYELVRDGARMGLTVCDWRSSAPEVTQGESSGNRWNRQNIWNNNVFYEYQASPAKPDFGILAVGNKRERRDLCFAIQYSGSVSDGIMCGDLEPLSEVLRKAEHPTVRQEPPDNKGGPYYVIETTSSYGHHKVWIDASKDYNLSRAEVSKGSGDLFNGSPITHLKSFASTLENIEYVKEGNTVYPKSCEFQRNWVYSDGTGRVEKFWHTKKSITFAPDLTRTNAFTPSIPNGTPAHFIDDPKKEAVQWIWKDGQIVPDIDDTIMKRLDSIVAPLVEDADAASQSRSPGGPNSTHDTGRAMPLASGETATHDGDLRGNIVRILAIPMILTAAVVGGVVWQRKCKGRRV